MKLWTFRDSRARAKSSTTRFHRRRVVEVRQGAFREGMGRAFNVGVRLLLLPDLRDTQCGFKLFTAQAARVAFRTSRLEGFCFDVEALVVARRHGLRNLPETRFGDIKHVLRLARERVQERLRERAAQQGT